MAEARVLVGLFVFCSFMEIQNISIYRESKVIIDHVKGACYINYPHLSGWLERIMYFWNLLNQPSIMHIPRSHNEQGDGLSKNGLSLEPGAWSLMISMGDSTCHIPDFFIPGI